MQLVMRMSNGLTPEEKFDSLRHELEELKSAIPSAQYGDLLWEAFLKEINGKHMGRFTYFKLDN